MNLDALAAHIKNLDPGEKPAVSDVERDYFRHYGINFEEKNPNITHHFGYFSSGRFDIVAHYFENKDAVETCFIVHGYYDHSGLYRHLIDYCLQRNFSVVIYDLPGHGLSTGEQASIVHFEDYQSVLCDVLRLFSGLAPAPWHAIGQSTGAAIVMNFLLAGNVIDSTPQVFSKAVLLAPLVRPANWLVSSVVHSIGKLFLKQVKREFAVNSHDQDFLEFLKHKDPLQSQYLSIQWVTALKRWLKNFYRLGPVGFVPLVIQGKEDHTVDWRHNMPVVKAKFPSARVYYLKDGRHQLVNEDEKIRKSIFSAMDIYFDVYSHDVNSTKDV
jgi:lysophospholipase